jgi:hypothetical protein
VILRQDPQAEDWHNEYSVGVDDGLIDSLLDEHIRMCKEVRGNDDEEDEDDAAAAERTESAPSPDEEE